MTTTERYKVGDLLIDAGTGSVLREDRRLELPPLTFALLLSLVRHAPEIARRQQLIDEVWNGAIVNDDALSQRIRLLRQSLADEGARPRYVASVRGWGYRMVAPVERLTSASSTATIAVLPFANLSGAPDDVPLCESLAESIIDRLTRVDDLRVIARTSSFAVSRLDLDACEAGRRLNADRLLEGSVRRADARVRVTVQLIDTSNGSHVWSERYDREFRDVLTLEDEIAEAVARRLGEKLDAKLFARTITTVDPGAHQAYMDARYYLARGGPAALAHAKSSLETSIAADARFAPAFDALAELYWYCGFFGGAAPREAFAQSTWHALRALELDESLAETHALLAMLRKEMDYNWPEVDRELRRARELSPSSPAVRLRYAISGLLPHARYAEALAEIDEVLLCDPLSVLVRWWSGAMAYLGRRAERCLAEAHAILALDSSHFLGYWLLGMGHELEGEFDRAVAALERADQLSGGMPFTSGFLAYVLGTGDRRNDVVAIADRLERARSASYVSPFACALGYIGLRDWDAAFRWLATAVDERDPLIMPVKSYPFLDGVRSDPRYKALLQNMHLEP